MQVLQLGCWLGPLHRHLNGCVQFTHPDTVAVFAVIFFSVRCNFLLRLPFCYPFPNPEKLTCCGRQLLLPCGLASTLFRDTVPISRHGGTAMDMAEARSGKGWRNSKSNMIPPHRSRNIARTIGCLLCYHHSPHILTRSTHTLTPRNNGYV